MYREVKIRSIENSMSQIKIDLHILQKKQISNKIKQNSFFCLWKVISLFGQLNKRRGGTRPKSWVDFTFIVYRVPRVPPSTNLCYKQRYKITARYNQTQIEFTFIVPRVSREDTVKKSLLPTKINNKCQVSYFLF